MYRAEEYKRHIRSLDKMEKAFLQIEINKGKLIDIGRADLL
jgi:major membrane immunogen (membrane-anchored lipoprotein)